MASRAEVSAAFQDLASRFVMNVPQEEQESFERIMFQVERAYWFYEDQMRTSVPALPHFGSLRPFAQRMFNECPMLKPYAYAFTDLYSKFTSYKMKVPTCGGILLNPQMTKVVLVNGFGKSKNSWTFPKGKVDLQNEPLLDCCVREVREETGLDIRANIRSPDDFLQATMHGQKVTLFIARDVPEDSYFLPETQGEISEIKWHAIKKLPMSRNQAGANQYWLVAPFVRLLKNWIATARKGGKRGGKRGGKKNKKLQQVQQVQQVHHHHQQQQQQAGGVPPSLQQMFAMAAQHQQQQPHPHNQAQQPHQPHHHQQPPPQQHLPMSPPPRATGSTTRSISVEELMRSGSAQGVPTPPMPSVPLQVPGDNQGAAFVEANAAASDHLRTLLGVPRTPQPAHTAPAHGVMQRPQTSPATATPPRPQTAPGMPRNGLLTPSALMHGQPYAAPSTPPPPGRGAPMAAGMLTPERLMAPPVFQAPMVSTPPPPQAVAAHGPRAHVTSPSPASFRFRVEGLGM